MTRSTLVPATERQSIRRHSWTPALAVAVEALEARRATGSEHQVRLASGEVVLDSDDALVDLVQEGGDTLAGWTVALEHFGVDEPDSTAGVP